MDRQLFYDYIVMREGKRLDVYRDTKGILTVGIGHRVVPQDALVFGQKITEQRCQALFQADYNRLGIDHYVSGRGFTQNQAMAVASFIWCHGDGQYKTSLLRTYVESPAKMGKTAFMYYLKANWDIKSAVNQERNRRDFEIFYQDLPWTSIQGAAEKVVNKVKSSGGSALVVLLGFILLFLSFKN